MGGPVHAGEPHREGGTTTSYPTTGRSSQRLAAALEGTGTARLLILEVDLTDEAQVRRAVAETEARSGGLDVVVNNAGHGFLGAIEEISDAEARSMFDVQVFGAWSVLRAALPGFRQRRSGNVVNVSSIPGMTTFPGWGLYRAGKLAPEAVSESLAAEVADQGIVVNVVEPGHTRTGFLSEGSLTLPSAPLDAHPAIRETTEQHQQMPGSQLGDPAEVAAAIIAVVVDGAPVHQVLGSDSLGTATARVEALGADVQAARELALTTDVEETAGSTVRGHGPAGPGRPRPGGPGRQPGQPAMTAVAVRPPSTSSRTPWTASASSLAR